MARIVPSLQLAKTAGLTHLHLHFRLRIEIVFAYSILRVALFSAASPGSSLGWLVGNWSRLVHEFENAHQYRNWEIAHASVCLEFELAYVFANLIYLSV